MLRWAEAFPEDLDRAWKEDRPALLPLGALEWHGSHLPLGLDLITAEAFSCRLATRLGGVLLPPLVAPITTLPHRHSLEVPSSVAPLVWRSYLEGIVASGARRVFVVTGHYAQGHMIELYRLSLSLMDSRPGVVVVAASPLELLGDDALLDHAAYWEASQLLALRPDLVKLDRLADRTSESAVLGDSPAGASASGGEEVFARALDAWESAASWQPSESAAFLARRLEAYASYESKWKTTTWEEAILSWWKARSAQA